MDPHQIEIHPNFRIKDIHVETEALSEVAYSLIKEGQDYERPVGDFLMDWLSPYPYIPVKTSGSTGAPKTINLLKDHMVQSALNTGEYFQLDSRCNALLCLPAHTIAGKMMLVRALVLGWNLDIVEPSSSPLLETIKTYDFCAMVPFQLRKSIKYVDRIKILIVGGAPIPEDLKSAIRDLDVAIYETYGMTETASHVAIRPINAKAILDSSNDQDLFETLPGVSISQDERGCLNIDAPKLSNSQVKTNDLVEIFSDNRFRWLGRWDNVINSGGVKLIPEVLEHKLFKVVSKRFVLLGLPDENLGEQLVMVVEGEDDAQLIFDKIQKLDTLHPYEKPKKVFTLIKFPETQGGKPSRTEISTQIQKRN